MNLYLLTLQYALLGTYLFYKFLQLVEAATHSFHKQALWGCCGIFLLLNSMLSYSFIIDAMDFLPLYLFNLHLLSAWMDLSSTVGLVVLLYDAIYWAVGRVSLA